MKPTLPEIDARGHRCPVPTLKLRRQMEAMTPGQTITLRADDPMAQIDVPHFCNQNNHVLESVESGDNEWLFRVRR